jgi:hypothetical protein
MRVWENSIGNGAKIIVKARNRDFFLIRCLTVKEIRKLMAK